MARIPKPNIRAPQMETFHKHHATNAIWMALPSPVTTIYSMVIAGSVTGLAYYFGDSLGNGKGQFWMYTVMAVMTVLGVGLVWWRARKIKKQAQQTESFEEAVKGSAAGWDAGGDPAEIARLDNLRKQFQKGVDAFREYGKDFYSLPWYVMVGEPGSGKTEAIRHSDLRFPETLQDMLQGTGGTYSMDWWFTNQAVLLDTAGAMLMNPEATQRFEEFLKLLRTYRPDCPVNGIILAIPVDSLLADNPAKLEEKAKRIAQQFTIIQRALDVRFPIYLMVTKSDRLPGWREFTDAAGQQTFDREMLGWSNPADLDAPFDPANIAGALDCIAGRLEARRLALLADPIPRQSGSRRVDEVDSLFGFPETIRSLHPRLQRYLEIIFQTGTWATLPPFFRGVYFTSAMNEGAALDEQLASALGMSIETLPGGGIFNRDKSVYLRDVFTEKIFKERGLVTRLKDIGRALRRKLIWFYATTAALLALLLLLAWMVKRNVEKELRMEQENWRVANATWGNGAFLPVVTRQEGADAADGSKTAPRWLATWQGENARVWKKRGDESSNQTKIEFLEYLEQRTAKGLPGAGIFRIMPSIREFERRRRVACLAVFEGSVLKPVLEGVREKIVWDAQVSGSKRDSGNDVRLASAYAALVHLEAALSGKASKVSWTRDEYQKLLEPMMAYLCPPDSKNPGTTPASVKDAASQLAKIADDLYSAPVFGSPATDSFASRAWLATSGDSPSDDPGRQALVKGLESLLAISDAVVLTDADKKQRQTEKDNLLREFEAAEDQLAKLDAASVSLARVHDHLQSMQKHMTSLDEVRAIMGDTAGMSPDELLPLCRSLKSSIEMLDEGERSAELQQIYLHASKFLANTSGGSAAPGGSGDSPAKTGDAKEPVIAADRAAGLRYELYQKRFTEVKRATSVRSANLAMIGKLKSELDSARTAVAPKTPAKLDYDGPRKDECAAVVGVIDACKSEVATVGLLKSYAEAMSAYMDSRLKFPLVLSQSKVFKASELGPALSALESVKRDWEYWEREAPANLTDYEEARVLAARFAKFKVVMDIATAVDPANVNKTTPEGLFVKRGGLERQKVRIPGEIPPLQIGPNGQIIPTPPVPDKEEERGPKLATAYQVKGSNLMHGDSDQQKKINPNKPLYFRVEFAQPTADPAEGMLPTGEFQKLRDDWGLVRWLSENKSGGAVSVGRVTFEVFSVPPLPARQDWPVRRDFGLTE